MHVEASPPSLRKKRPQLSKRFERVVMKCLAKHPDDRYRDANALLADLEAVDGKPATGWLARWRGWWAGGSGAAEQRTGPGHNAREREGGDGSDRLRRAH